MITDMLSLLVLIALASFPPLMTSQMF